MAASHRLSVSQTLTVFSNHGCPRTPQLLSRGSVRVYSSENFHGCRLAFLYLMSNPRSRPRLNCLLLYLKNLVAPQRGHVLLPMPETLPSVRLKLPSRRISRYIPRIVGDNAFGGALPKPLAFHDCAKWIASAAVFCAPGGTSGSRCWVPNTPTAGL